MIYCSHYFRLILNLAISYCQPLHFSLNELKYPSQTFLTYNTFLVINSKHSQTLFISNNTIKFLWWSIQFVIVINTKASNTPNVVSKITMKKYLDTLFSKKKFSYHEHWSAPFGSFPTIVAKIFNKCENTTEIANFDESYFNKNSLIN